MFSKKIKIRCAHCGKEFARFPSQVTGAKSYCSRECKWNGENTANLVCDYCGKPFHRAASETEKARRNNSTQVFCSRECYEAHRDNVPEGHRPNGRWGKHRVRCSQCGKEMFLRPSRLNVTQYYCSRECRAQYRLTHPERGKWSGRKDSLVNKPVCEICGLQEPEILVIHHKDRNRKNNRPENLQVLCPNCHWRVHHE